MKPQSGWHVRLKGFPEESSVLSPKSPVRCPTMHRVMKTVLSPKSPVLSPKSDGVMKPSSNPSPLSAVQTCME